MPAPPLSDTAAQTLEDHLKERIAREGPISVEAYMACCLSDPKHGYYVTGNPLGAQGDFVTAPEISQAFGELIGLWCGVVWQAMGSPEPFNLVELGPGRGTLMNDALRAAKAIAGFNEAAAVHLVEINHTLRREQECTLGAHRGATHWHECFEAVPERPSIIIGNEFLDALPVQHHVRQSDGWHERCVTLDENGELSFCVSETASEPGPLIPAPIQEKANVGDIAEVRPGVRPLMASLAERAKDHPLACLFIDYGHCESAPGETLQAMFGHDYVDPLKNPGGHDLTAHVDFDDVASVAHNAGLTIYGPMTQGAFLMALGLKERTERLIAKADDESAKQLISGAQRLAEPDKMGQLFKVIALTSSGIEPPPFKG